MSRHDCSYPYRVLSACLYPDLFDNIVINALTLKAIIGDQLIVQMMDVILSRDGGFSSRSSAEMRVKNSEVSD